MGSLSTVAITKLAFIENDLLLNKTTKIKIKIIFKLIIFIHHLISSKELTKKQPIKKLIATGPIPAK